MQKIKFAVALFACVLIAAGSAMAAQYTIKLGHIANTEHTWHKASEKFKEIVEKETQGRVEVIIYPNNELGSEMEVIDGIHGGLAHMTLSGDSLANWAPSITLTSVPYMIRDIEHMDEILNSEAGKIMADEVINKIGLRPIAAFARAPRNVTSKRPVVTPADIAGIKIRVSNVPLHVACWEAIGAKATPMAFTEVFTSLQQSVIDAQENPVDLIRSASFYEVQKYVNRTEHVITWIYFLIGEDFFQELPKDIQDVILKAGEEVQAYERALHLESVRENEDFLKEKGMEFIDSDREAFAKAMQPTIEKFLENLDKTKKTDITRLYKQIIAM